MALLTWAQISATQWTREGLYSRLDKHAAEYLAQTAANPKGQEEVMSSLRDRLTDHYLNRLILKCRSDYPDDVSSVETMIMRLQDQANEYSEYANKVNATDQAVPPMSGFLQTASAWPAGSSAWTPTGGQYGFAGDIFPRIFMAQPPIANTMFAGCAETGEFLGLMGPSSDGSGMPAQRIYINSGTLAAPAWTAFDSDSLVNFIINPMRIQEVGYQRWKYYICEYAVLGDVDTEWRLDKIPPFLKQMRTDLDKEEDSAFAIIRISLAGTGIANDYERKTATNRKYVF